jgi:ribosome modulation factor
VDYALYLRKTQPEVAEELHRQQLKVARWLAHPIGTQSSFDLDLELPIDRAFLDGRAAGMEGVAATVPPKFSVSHEASNRWLEGWHAGQAALMSNIKTLQKEDDDADDYEETPFYEDNDPLEGIP